MAENFSIKPVPGEKVKVTIYTTSEMMGNVVAREGTLVEYGRRRYAQYDSAPFVTYVPKGCRRPEGFVKGYRPYLIIVHGWNRPQPGELYGRTISEDDKVVVKAGTYRSFDDGWTRDFDKVFQAAVADGTIKTEDVLLDVRERNAS